MAKRVCDHHTYHLAPEIDAAARDGLKAVYQSDELLREALKLPEPEPRDYARERVALESERSNLLRLALKGIVTDEELEQERRRIDAPLSALDEPRPAPRATEAILAA